VTFHVVIGQVPIDWDPAKNTRRVVAFLREECSPRCLAVLPEAVLSGYDDDLSGLDALDAAALARAWGAVGAAAAALGVHVLAGSLVPAEDGWGNAALYFGPAGERWTYRKVNLATHERGRLVAGDALPLLDVPAGAASLAGPAASAGPAAPAVSVVSVVSVAAGSGRISIGVQLCRELKYPEQWQVLSRSGASVLAYLTYAANPKVPAGVWRSHLISRAAENQRFVLAANVASPDQHCPSMVISPHGEVLAESATTGAEVLHADLDLTQTSDWLLSQQRGDVVAVRYLR
jgi:predicted amidohydrolase